MITGRIGAHNASMADFPTNLSYRVLPYAVLRSIGDLIQQQEQQTAAVLLTEADLSQAVSADQQFWLLASPSLTVLLISQRHRDAMTKDTTVEVSHHQSLYRVGLTFDGGVIADFLAILTETADLTGKQRQQLAACKATLEMANSTAQGEFILSLMEVFSQASAPVDQSLMCQPVHRALSHQQDKSLLLNQVISKIQESLDLSVILETTVAEVRQFLQADRLLIYQFDAKKSSISRSMAEFQPQNEPRLAVSHAHHNGYITYESRASDELSSVLHYTETYCLMRSRNAANAI
jgi:two-component system sensor histidine kinase/response regulator